MHWLSNQGQQLCMVIVLNLHQREYHMSLEGIVFLSYQLTNSFHPFLMVCIPHIWFVFPFFVLQLLYFLETHKLNIVTLFYFFNFCTIVIWVRNIYSKHVWSDCLNISSHESLSRQTFFKKAFFIVDFIFMFHVNQSHLHS